MLRAVLLISFCIILFHIKAQDNLPSPIYEDIIPPSPEATSLGKFGDTPISFNTGTPQISIPIHNIEGQDIGHSISLVYDAKGNKVADVASMVGLGWTLKAGGVVARTIRGKPDDDVENGYFIRRPQWESLEGSTYNVMPGHPDYYYSHQKYIFEEEAAIGKIDLLPDAFSFNFGDYSGTITFRYESNSDEFYPIISPAQDIKVIHPFSGGANEWVFITPDGVKYIFARTENINMHPGFYTNSWYLTNIVSPNQKETINFLYHQINGGPPLSLNFSNAMTTILKKKVYISGNSQDQFFCHPSPQNTDIMEDYTYPFVFFLKEIIYTANTDMGGAYSTKVLFHISENRPCDYMHGFTQKLVKLESIKIADGNVKYLYLPIHVNDVDSVFDIHGSSGWVQCTSSNRLQLTGLRIFSNIGDSWPGFSNSYEMNPGYTFEYNNIPMPQYNAISDHWGYPNGHHLSTNGSFLPVLPSYYFNHFHPNPLLVANRKPHHSATLAGLINKITYPTGGYTEFEFEPHRLERYKKANGVTQKSITATAHQDYNLHGSMNVHELHIRGLWEAQDTQFENGLPIVRAVNFNLQKSQEVVINSNFSPEGLYAFPTRSYLYKAPITDVWDFIGFPNGSPMYLGAGNYVLVAMVAEDLTGVSSSLSINYTEESQQVTYTTELVGGARIKSMKDVSVTNPEDNKTTNFYYYGNYINHLKMIPELTQEFVIDGETITIYTGKQPVSSGTLHYETVYLDEARCDDIIVSATNSNPFGRFKGHHIGYSEVTAEVKGKESGFTVYKFVNTANPDFRDQPKSVQYFDSDFNLLSEDIYYYDTAFYSAMSTGIKMRVKEVVHTGGPGVFMSIFEDDINRTQYNYGSSWRPKTRKISRTFDRNGKSLEQVTEYSYFTEGFDLSDQIYYQLKTSERTTLNNGFKIVKNWIYPPQNLTDFYSIAMLDANLHGMVLEGFLELEKPDGTRNKITGLKYEFFPGGLFRPVKEFVWNNKLDSYELSREFSHYPFGRVEEIENHRTGIKTSFIWDETTKHLRHMIHNAGLSDVQVIDQPISSQFEVSAANNGPYNLFYTYKTDPSASGDWISHSESFENYIAGTQITPSMPPPPGSGPLEYKEYKDVRFIPKYSTHKSYHFIPGLGINQITDENYFHTYFNYDIKLKLENILDHKRQFISEFEYGYQLFLD